MEIYMKKNTRNYTLIEILAAMGVFMIICLVVMRFFSGAQRVIVNTSNKNNLHADVRVFFDLIGRDLQSIVYRNTVGAEGIYPFAHSYYKFDSVPLNQKSNMEKFYKNVVPKRFEKELSYDNRDYAPLLCFISSQSNLPRDADYDLSEIRYTFVPAGIYEASYNYRESASVTDATKFSGGALLRSCTYSDKNKTTSKYDPGVSRHPHDFSTFPIIDLSDNPVPLDDKNRIYQVFKDDSSRKFERVISGVYRMNISCYKFDSEGKIKKIKMFNVNESFASPTQKKDINDDTADPNDNYLEWPPLPSDPDYKIYPSPPADPNNPILLGQLGHPLPNMIKVDLYMLDTKSWDDLMNCYKVDGSDYTLIHEEEAKKILNRKLRYFTKTFYIPKVDTSTL